MDNNQQKNEKSVINNLPFLDHLEEFRRRLIRIVLSFIVLAIGAYIFKEDILQLLMEPVKDLDVKFIHLKIYDFFMAYLKISLYTGILLSAPIIIYQISQFVLPALYSSERKWFYSGLAFFLVFFFVGAFFSYRYLAPISAEFMITFTKSQSIPETIDMYRFNDEIIKKLPSHTSSDFMFTVYEKDVDNNRYILKSGLSLKDTSKIVDILRSVQFDPSNPSKKTQDNSEEFKKLQAIERKLNKIDDNLQALVKKQEKGRNPSDDSLTLTRQFLDYLEVNREIYKNLQRKMDFMTLQTDPILKKDDSHKKLVESHLSIADYLDWIVFIILIVGVVFQLPLVITLLAKIGIVTDRSLTKFRPYALVAILVVAAIITPPDAITQIMVGAPVYLLYEASIIMARLMRKMKEKKEREVEE